MSRLLYSVYYMGMGRESTTPFGRWADAQPRGVLTRAQRATGLAYSTVFAAKTQFMSPDVARKLSRFTKGEVKASQIVKRSSDLIEASS